MSFPPPRRRRSQVYTPRALGDARVLALVEAAGAGDWPAPKAALPLVDLGRDHQVLLELAQVDGVQDWIGQAIEDEREDRASALLIAGARYVARGWEARTADGAANVTPEQWRTFLRRLRIAEEYLLEAVESRPGWVTPWGRLLTLGRGMSLGAEVNGARLADALHRDPLDLETHLEWLSHLRTRWGGAPGQASAFARDALARAPRGHRLGCGIAMAHIHDWIEADDGECSTPPESQAELRRAVDHGIPHPAYVFRPGWQYDFNVFAMALALADERHTIRRVFRTLDGAFAVRPWLRLAEPEKEFTRHHRRA
ncbi:hypothetical protein [Streptomyces buecherae]|uniref:hypothetical protein n=1 Tax=Streptomyces buecherae TaxID=2763006 RepID=UPI001E6155A2|nr:hypothetical protein [Streptomyces buecherae]